MKFYLIFDLQIMFNQVTVIPMINHFLFRLWLYVVKNCTMVLLFLTFSFFQMFSKYMT